MEIAKYNPYTNAYEYITDWNGTKEIAAADAYISITSLAPGQCLSIKATPSIAATVSPMDAKPLEKVPSKFVFVIRIDMCQVTFFMLSLSIFRFKSMHTNNSFFIAENVQQSHRSRHVRLPVELPVAASFNRADRHASEFQSQPGTLRTFEY